MKKCYLLLAGVSVGLLAVALAGCEPKAAKPADQPAVMEKTVGELKSVSEDPAAAKPKDHPAH